MFAELPPPDQKERVLTVLRGLIGETPTKSDYIMLMLATQEALNALYDIARTISTYDPRHQ